MFIKKILLLPVIFISLLTFSCSDSPTSTGADLLKDDFINVNQIDSFADSLSQTSTYFKRIAPLGSSEMIMVGKSNNAEASALLNFFIFLSDTLLEDVRKDSINIISATVEMQKTYTFGDSNAVVDFSVHKINNAWNSNTFTVDSLALLQSEANDMSSEKNITDTIVSFKLDNSVVLEWMKDGEDSVTTSDFGMYIKPTDASQKIIGLQALSGVTGTSGSIPNLIIIFEKPGSYRDTITFVPEGDVSVVTGSLPNISSENIAVQSGLVINSKIWFDLSSIPQNSVINYAELTLTSDTLQTVTGSSFTKSLNAYALLDSAVIDTLPKHASNLSTLLALSSPEDKNKFQGNITAIIQNILNRGNNFGILITAGAELEGLELFAIKGSSAANRAQRPQLKIIYTNKQ